ncbi:inosine-5-monophosphate dehydrogenase [Candidatus Woesearchaeota archaeon]|nr:MAG: inosine-5-monophosphate dehydrogenase [Candidatus Woesearchaeota archaeon]
MNYKVYDAMTISPVTVSKEETVQHAAQKMKQNHVASLVVRDGDKFIALVTEKDITRKLAANGLSANDTKVSQIMSSSVRTTSSTADIIKTLSIMSKINQRQMPVVDNGKLVGLLTLKDVLRVQPQLFGLVYENINLKEEDRKPIYKSGHSEGVCESCGLYSQRLVEVDGEMVCAECKEML